MHSLVMLSGGLDSAVLAAEEARTYVVHPVYVAAGLAWEEGEQRVIRQLLDRPPFANGRNRIQPLARLEFSMRDIYPETHWAMTGRPPAYDTPDEDVYLHGRNIALLSKAAVYAASRRISRIVVAPLAGNPFPDASRPHSTRQRSGVSHRETDCPRAARRRCARFCGWRRTPRLSTEARCCVRADRHLHRVCRTRAACR